MKTKNIILSSVLGMAFMAFGTSCDDGFDGINSDPNKVPDNKHTFYLTDISQAIQYSCDYNYSKNGGAQGGADIHQRVKALSIDVFTQYNMGGAAQAAYSPNDEWQSKYWGAHFVSYLGVLNSAIQIAEANEDANATAIGLVWRANVQAMATDYYGLTPFPVEPTNGEKPPYMDLQKQYEIIFADLDKAISLFDASKSTITTEPLYKGDVSKWKKFCNTLRLRFALKMSEVDPTLCSTQAQKALSASGGVFGSSEDDALAPTYGGWGSANYVYTYYYSWGGGPTEMTKTMEDILTGIGGQPYNGEATGVHPAKVDPRGSRMFDPSTTGSNFQGGIVSQNPEPGNYRDGVSRMSAKYVSQNLTRKLRVMTYAEACFLLAEAVERNFVSSGDAGGSAEQWYNKGVETSFIDWEFTAADAATYLASADKNAWGTSAKYGDAVSDPGNSNLEKIVTQRYIAFFPDLANQVWNDKRRLNLPAMHIPQYRNTGDGTWPTDGDIKNPANFIQRTAYPQSEPKLNRENYEAAVSLLGGDGDKASTPLWWASKKANYCTSNNP